MPPTQESVRPAGDPAEDGFLVGRYYDPGTAQFLSIDPDVAETGQPYAFTADDPLNATDPLGLKKLTERQIVSNYLHALQARSRHAAAVVKAFVNAGPEIGRNTAGSGLYGSLKWTAVHRGPILAVTTAVSVVATAGTATSWDLGIDAALNSAVNSTAAQVAVRAAPTVATIAAGSLASNRGEQEFEDIANNPNYPGPTRSVASFDAHALSILDPLSTLHDTWELFGGE